MPAADGTWKTTAGETNVYRLFTALPKTASQMALYDDGVGADGNPISKLLGRAFGIVRQDQGRVHADRPGVRCRRPALSVWLQPECLYRAEPRGNDRGLRIAYEESTDDLVETALNAYRDKDNRGGVAGHSERLWNVRRPNYGGRSRGYGRLTGYTIRARSGRSDPVRFSRYFGASGRA